MGDIPQSPAAQTNATLGKLTDPPLDTLDHATAMNLLRWIHDNMGGGGSTIEDLLREPQIINFDGTIQMQKGQNLYAVRYCTPTGAGSKNGTSWNSAWGPAELALEMNQDNLGSRVRVMFQRGRNGIPLMYDLTPLGSEGVVIGSYHRTVELVLEPAAPLSYGPWPTDDVVSAAFFSGAPGSALITNRGLSQLNIKGLFLAGAGIGFGNATVGIDSQPGPCGLFLDGVLVQGFPNVGIRSRNFACIARSYLFNNRVAVDAFNTLTLNRNQIGMCQGGNNVLQFNNGGPNNILWVRENDFSRCYTPYNYLFNVTGSPFAVGSVIADNILPQDIDFCNLSDLEGVNLVNNKVLRTPFYQQFSVNNNGYMQSVASSGGPVWKIGRRVANLDLRVHYQNLTGSQYADWELWTSCPNDNSQILYSKGRISALDPVDVLHIYGLQLENTAAYPTFDFRLNNPNPVNVYGSWGWN